MRLTFTVIVSVPVVVVPLIGVTVSQLASFEIDQFNSPIPVFLIENDNALVVSPKPSAPCETESCGDCVVIVKVTLLMSQSVFEFTEAVTNVAAEMRLNGTS